MSAARTLSVNPSHPEELVVAEAARVLRDGGLVAFPTETVYGLAADAGNPKALDRLNRVKGRPPEKPYSIHLGDPEQLRQFVKDVPPVANRLIQRFWPGPLTVVIPSGREGWLGFRLPNHPVARAFLRLCRCRVVAPSANRSGFPPPTDAREVVEALDGQFDCLLDAGPTPVGRESTVVQIDGDRVTVLREGAIPSKTILEVTKA